MKCCDDRLNPPSIPETLAINREFPAYWIPAFAGMTGLGWAGTFAP
jgi:hypothetical protein